MVAPAAVSPEAGVQIQELEEDRQRDRPLSSESGVGELGLHVTTGANEGPRTLGRCESALDDDWSDEAAEDGREQDGGDEPREGAWAEERHGLRRKRSQPCLERARRKRTNGPRYGPRTRTRIGSLGMDPDASATRT